MASNDWTGRRERDTVLVTVGVSWNTSMNSVLKLLRRELGTASNIKAKGTRKMVSRALTRAHDRLVGMANPPNGFFLFAAHDGIWTVEPDRPLCKNFYHCGKSFLTDELRALSEAAERIGVIDIDKKGAVISVRTGAFMDIKHTLSSGIGGDHNQGGQSQGRFRRKREEAVKAFIRRVEEHARTVSVDRWEVRGSLAKRVSILG